VPDKRFTFDRDRPRMPIEHLVGHLERPSSVNRRSLSQNGCICDHVEDEEAAPRRVDELMGPDYSTHHHIWPHSDVLELLLLLCTGFGREFDVEIDVRNTHENVFVLRKASPAREAQATVSTA
jgi:hypothetical protein